MHSKIAQSGTMELQDVTGLQFDDLAARFSPYNWEEFFARIPIEEQKETKFAYDAQQTIDGYLPKGKGLTIQKMLDNHPFGHLIAENMKRVVGLTPVHVVHHIAYDNGDEASLIHKLLHVDVQDEEDMEEDEEGDIKKAHSTHTACLPYKDWVGLQVRSSFFWAVPTLTVSLYLGGRSCCSLRLTILKTALSSIHLQRRTGFALPMVL